MLDTRDRDPLRPEHSSGQPRAICVTARGVLLDARFYCVLRISLVAHIDATCAPAIVRMDATHLVAILAVWRVIVAAIGVIGVVVVVIPERTAKIGEPATIATAVIIPAAAITVPIRVAVVAPFAERDGCAAGAVAVGDGSVPGPPPASGVGSTRPVSGCDGIVAAGPSPGEGNSAR